MQPFEIQIPDAVLDDLRERLSRTRFPDQIEGAEWKYGTELSFHQELVQYWLDKYDWRTHERELNRFDHFKTPIESAGETIDLHFIHQRSPEPNAKPLVITHGWPGSVYEFHKIIGPLTDPVAHGGRAEDAFHVVCPSIPGFGFSSAPRKPGFDAKRAAETIITLMAKLGYESYGAQGGDWGAVITPWIGTLDPQHCMGIHLTMLIAGPPAGVANPAEGLTPQELQGLADAGAFQKDGAGYQQIQGTRPQTLGYGLTDSPSGLAAWIVEKFHAWTDCDGDVESLFSKDELLTNIMFYWVTQSITSSTRIYYESMKTGHFGPHPEPVTVPTAGAIFPKEIYRVPRKWAEAVFNVQRWNLFDKGGHFAALEQPKVLVDDMRAFFRDLG